MLEQTVVAAIYQVWLELKGARLLRAMSQQVRGTARLPAEALSRLLLLEVVIDSDQRSHKAEKVSSPGGGSPSVDGDTSPFKLNESVMP